MTDLRKANREPDSSRGSQHYQFLTLPGSLIVLVYVALLLVFLPLAQAAPAAANEATLRAAVAQAVALEHPSATNQAALRILSRGDLSGDLAKITPKGADVSFYEAQPPAGDPTADRSIWAVVSHDSPLEPYGLYDFESSQRLDQAAGEFNRLVSQLGLAVTNTNADELAHFFLECCALGDSGDPVANEDLLHHSIERDYMQVFGEDVYRALSAFTEWWQGYAASQYEFPPAVEAEDGGAFHVALERVVLNFGMHPQLQQCNLEISHDGKVQVGAVEAVFPKQSRWLSYDSRTDVPQFHSVGDELDRLKALIKH
jgi:hypothetical protein